MNSNETPPTGNRENTLLAGSSPAMRTILSNFLGCVNPIGFIGSFDVFVFIVIQIRVQFLI
jgi:hypothetical protein